MSPLFLISNDVITENLGFLKQCSSFDAALEYMYMYFIILVNLGATPDVHVFQYFGSLLVPYLIWMYFSILVHLWCYTRCHYTFKILDNLSQQVMVILTAFEYSHRGIRMMVHSHPAKAKFFLDVCNFFLFDFIQCE